MQNRYFDNAATSFPKPAGVAIAMHKYLVEIGGTYGRAAYDRVREASSVVEHVREMIGVLLGTKHDANIVFTMNATHAINMVLFGLQLKNAHVLLSPMEHNAVMRPLDELRRRGLLTYEVLPHSPDGSIEPESIHAAIKPNTSLIVVNHQSNCNGVIQPVREIKREAGTIPVLLDSSQALGHTIYDVDEWGIDFVAFTGHKGLLGPSGTGGLYMKEPDRLTPFIFGGTGSRSESFEMPLFTPDKFEAGTPNIVGLYGLYSALKEPPTPLHTRDQFLKLITAVGQLDTITVFDADDSKNQGPVFSFTHHKKDSATISQELFEKYSIETRPGLHCAPLAHKTLGTFPVGTVRIAPSVYHTPDDFEYLYHAIELL